MNGQGRFDRRRFLGGAAASAVASTVAVPRRALAARENAAPPQRGKICAFIKFLQSLTFDELAKAIADLGFDGIEATVRDGGQIEPAKVEEQLPALVEALDKQGLSIGVMASSVNRVDQPHTEKVLRTAAKLGVNCYRMAYYRYDAKRPVLEQLRELEPQVKELAALNRELGIRAVYQNHAGPRIVGAPIWDLHHLLRRYPISEIGVAFDIRHATVEGGMSWPVNFRLMREHLGAVYVKDFEWRKEDRTPHNVPLGQGRIDGRFFKMLKEMKYEGLYSLHVEYLPKAGVAANLRALKQDLASLRTRFGVGND